MAEVLESLLIGSVKTDSDLPAEEEFNVYRAVVIELLQRLEEAQACYG